MELVNNTPFTFAPLSGRIGFPGHSLTLIVKGTFELAADGRCVPAAEQYFPSGDVLYPDDSEGNGSNRYESDFAYYKPQADILLSGKCYAPDGKPVPACQATFKVGPYGKTVGVFGDRVWKGVMPSIGDPELFTEMDLRYENCFGGPGYGPNPVGKGYGSGSGAPKKLPNIEDLNQLVDSPGRCPAPAGLGPVPRTWQQRVSKLGSYGGSWFKGRWPWFAEDFDWTYFNAAPVDTRASGYLKGNEPLFLQNLHPTVGQYHATLPGLRLRVFTEIAASGGSAPDFRETEVHLDTLWVDTDTAQLILVWRGVIAVASSDYEELRHVFITSEPMDRPTASLDEMQRLFHQVIEDQKKRLDISPIEPEEAYVDIPIDMREIENVLKASEQKRQDVMIAAGLDPKEGGTEPDPSARQAEVELLEQLGLVPDSEPEAHTRESVQQSIASGENMSGQDLSGLDLSQLNLQGADFSETILTGVNFSESELSGCDLTGADLSVANFHRSVLEGAVLNDADLTGARLCEANLRKAVLKGTVFDDAVLTRANLDACMANRASFRGADLSHAFFSNSSCQEADFSKSRLVGASFVNADLSQATLGDAIGRHIDMSGACLTGVRASGQTDLSMGRFREVSAPYSIWEEVVLNGSDFSFAQLEGANFAAASLVESDFSCADLKYARLSKASLCQGKWVSVNLFQANLEQADLTETDMRMSNIYGAELLDAVVHGTRFDGANLKMTKLAL